VACLHEWSKNENNCPVDQEKFDFIRVRRQLGGEIFTIIPVEPIKEQSECIREGREPVGGKFTLGHVLYMALMYGFIRLNPYLWNVFQEYLQEYLTMDQTSKF
jgi:hypothetical protein